MNIVYESPDNGVFWSLIVFMFLVAATIIGVIWYKIRQEK